MANSADPDPYQLIWSYTVCKGRAYPGSAGQGLSIEFNTKVMLIGTKPSKAFCLDHTGGGTQFMTLLHFFTSLVIL